jgi:hypothetical protein
MQMEVVNSNCISTVTVRLQKKLTAIPIIKKKNNKALEGGLEPPTLWLTAIRSNQLSYSSF